MGIIEGPCGYSIRPMGTQGKLVFRETLGESAPVGPRIGVLGIRQYLPGESSTHMVPL